MLGENMSARKGGREGLAWALFSQEFPVQTPDLRHECSWSPHCVFCVFSGRPTPSMAQILLFSARNLPCQLQPPGQRLLPLLTSGL